VPITGGEGVSGCAGITTLAEGADMQPEALVTAKLYIPVARSEIVVLVPVPEDCIVPGYRVIIHIPVAGRPVNSTVPVDNVHVGGVIVPTNGAVGISG